jgi:hypothetical protein
MVRCHAHYGANKLRVILICRARFVACRAQSWLAAAGVLWPHCLSTRMHLEDRVGMLAQILLDH